MSKKVPENLDKFAGAAGKAKEVGRTVSDTTTTAAGKVAGASTAAAGAVGSTAEDVAGNVSEFVGENPKIFIPTGVIGAAALVLAMVWLIRRLVESD